MSRTVRESARHFLIQLNPAMLRQTGGATKAAGHGPEGRPAQARTMPNGDPPPSVLWGAEKG